jgi:hypothetical protein
MHPLAQRIAHFQQTNDLLGERLDHRDLEPEPKVLHFGAERLALIEQRLGPHRQRMQALQQRRRGPLLPELLHRGSGRRQRIARQIDPIEVAKILAAVLKVIVDLQAGAQRVRGRPGRNALAMDVEHEAADRHGRIPAIMNYLVPVLVTKFCHIHPERDEDIERVTGRHRTLRQRAAKIDGLGLAVAASQQLRLEQVEQSELLARFERGVIGDVVGGTHKIVERKDQRPVTRMNDPRRDRKVLVAVSLAGSQFARGCHQELATFAGNTGFACLGIARARERDREPHIGEYDAKTNAIRRVLQFPPLPNQAGNGPRRQLGNSRAGFIARGFSAPDRRPCLFWSDSAAGKPER